MTVASFIVINIMCPITRKASRLARFLSKRQKFLLKYFFIMSGGVYYFKKPCGTCHNYVEANDVVDKFEGHNAYKL
jgi:predicted PP-loop superfamily ATPase